MLSATDLGEVPGRRGQGFFAVRWARRASRKLRRLATELAAAGRTVRTGYPLGQWRLDLVVGERAAAVKLAQELRSGVQV